MQKLSIIVQEQSNTTYVKDAIMLQAKQVFKYIYTNQTVCFNFLINNYWNYIFGNDYFCICFHLILGIS